MAQQIVAPAARWGAREGKSFVFHASLARGGRDRYEVSLSPMRSLGCAQKDDLPCIREVIGKEEVNVQQATFGTLSQELKRLGEWRKKNKVKRVAMESTGVYWIPVWNILEQKRYGLELLLVNPAQVKALPGQKTDPKDAARIAELHQ